MTKLIFEQDIPSNRDKVQEGASTLTPLQRALIALRKARVRIEELESATGEAIAIIGLACRFPADGTDPTAFWQALEAGVDGVRRIPVERWPANAIAKDNLATRWAGLLPSLDTFDATFFGISPREAVLMDPQQRLLLEVAYEALERSGHATDRLMATKTGVFVGMVGTDYGNLVREAEVFDMYSSTGNIHSVAAGRISYVLGLQGPSIVVDTACSSSLVAVHLACQSLRNQESDIALAGGVNAILDPVGMSMAAALQALSPDGRCKTFDAEANGFVRGEGCGIVVLKRLSDAERDGDPILAVIRGSVVNQDGRSTGMTAPNVLSQQAMLLRALEVSRLSAEDIGYVETHGTGTSLGDPIEFEALREVLGKPRADGSTCVLGALKTNVGHMEGAAGIGGLIKAILCLQHEAIPKNLHFKTLNPRMSLEGTPFVIPTETIPWKSNGKPRRAGVSSFGISGTNAHVILEEAPRREEKPFQEASSYLLSLSAKTPEALSATAKSYQEWFATTDAPLHHVAYTASLRRSHLEHRLSVVGSTKEEIAAALGAFAMGEVPPGVATGKTAQSTPKVVFVFPGQGSQWVGMGRQLYREEPAFRDALVACDVAIRKEAGVSVVEELDKPEETSRLSDIDVVQPVLFAIEVALAALWRSWGVEPAAVVGHSMGEVAAAFVAGALSMTDAAAIICRRSRLLRTLSGKGAMALVELAMPDAEKALLGYEIRLSVAVSNGPRSTVIAGDPSAIEEVLGKLEKDGVFCQRIKADVASHSPQMDPLLGDVIAALSDISPNELRIPMRSTVTGELVSGAELVGKYWADNLRRPVLFSNVIDQWIADGFTIFLEMSPHPVLLPFVDENLSDKKANGAVLASLRYGRDERQSMLSSLGALFVRGVPVDWKAFFPDGGRVVELPSYPWQRERYWIEPSTGSASTTKSFIASHSAGSNHPLVGVSFTSSLNPESRFWQQSLSVAAIPWLAEHRVQGEIVFPGAGYVECALEAGAETLGAGHVLLEDIAFERMMVFGEDQARDVEVVFIDDGSRKSFRISSQSENSPWMRHASGYIQSLEKVAADKAELPNTIAGRLPQVIDVAGYYEGIRARHAYHGPPFQGIVELRASESEALAKIRLPEDVRDKGYVIHPALLDACLQVSGAIGLTSSDTDTYVPVGIERLHLFQRPSRESWVLATKSAKNATAYDLRVTDENGNVLVAIEGLRSQRIDRVARSTDPLDGCVYEVAWRSADAMTEPKLPVGGTWLVFADRSGTSDALTERLVAHGQRCIRIVPGASYTSVSPNEIRVNPSKPEDYRRIFTETFGEDGLCAGVVHLASLDVTPFEQTTIESLTADLTHASVSATYLAQATVRHGFRYAPRLFLITRGAQSVHSADPVSVAQSSILGLGKAITMEHPELRCTRIDLPAEESENDTDLLWRELGSNDREDQIALREKSRFIARLVPQKLKDTTGVPEAIRADRTYLITGGLGGLGLLLAKWLVEQGARSLVLVGRKGPSDEARVAIRTMEDGAHIHCAQVDVSDESDVEKLFSMIRTGMPPLGGIVHAAVVLDDHTLLEQSEESFQKSFAPKALGAWNLHKHSQSLELDFFVMYSSGASLIGSPGQANYCASNAFLDALCRERARRGLPGMSIQWGAFSDVGGAAALDIRGKRVSYRGVGSFSPAEGLDAFRRLLASPRPEVGIVRFDPRQWVEFYPSTAGVPFFAEVMKQDANREKSTSRAKEMRERLQKASPEERLPLLERHLMEQVGTVLRLDPARIDRTVPLQSLGMDSLMSLELRNRLETSLGTRLSATIIFTYSTTARLAEHLLGRLDIAAAGPPNSATDSLDSPLSPIDDEPTGDDEFLAATDTSIAAFKKVGQP